MSNEVLIYTDELDKNAVCANISHTASDSKKYNVKYNNFRCYYFCRL